MNINHLCMNCMKEKIYKMNCELSKYGYDLIEFEHENNEIIEILNEDEYFKNGEIYISRELEKEICLGEYERDVIVYSLQDDFGNVVGGHLSDGCVVNTTAEMVISSIDKFIEKAN